ncbi:MAG TPA: hypothetical protein VMT89_03915, partial [Candidatus Acidoferrales bacterium]|nr:hypothetical protein [Candidatus Acidoferrales bacterium]
DRIAHNRLEGLDTDGFAAARPQAFSVDDGHNFTLRVLCRSDQFKRSPDVRCAFRVWNDSRPTPTRTDVSQRRSDRPAASFESCNHSRFRPLGLDVILELREASENILHELPGRRIVDRLCRRPQGDAHLFEQGAKRGVDIVIARESTQGMDDNELNSAAVFGAIGNQLPKFGPLGGLCRFALFYEEPRYIEAVTRAVIEASLALGGKT